MGFCRTCGKAVGTWNFCQYCGTRLNVLNLTYQNTNSLLRQNVVFNDETKRETDNADLHTAFKKNLTSGTEIKKTVPGVKTEEAPGFETQDIFSHTEDYVKNIADNAKTSAEISDDPDTEHEILFQAGATVETEDLKTEIEEPLSIPTETEEKPMPAVKTEEAPGFETQDIFSHTEESAEQPLSESVELIPEDKARENDTAVDDEVPLNLSGLFGHIHESPPPEDDSSDSEPSEIIKEDNNNLSGDLFDSDNNKPEPIPQTNSDTADDESFSGFLRVDFDSEEIMEDDFPAESHEQDIHNEEPNRQDDRPEQFESVVQQPEHFEPVNVKAKPVFSTSEIDSMFGEAPSFDIEYIKESYRAEKAKEKKKSKKWFFGRER